MKQFLARVTYFSLIGISPILILLCTYFYFDPFKVIRHYNDYSYSNVILNRDYISTTMFIKNNKRNMYNSFIFGSSRTVAFRSSSWQKYLNVNDKPFMFDASGESIYGIYKKIKFLDSINVEIKNALIILCRDVSFYNSKNHSGHLFIKHPEISGENHFYFHNEFFKAYITPKFLFNFYCYKIIGEYEPFMADYIENRKITYDTITNEINIVDQEIEISQNPEEYYRKRKKIFYKRYGEQADTNPMINNSQLIMLHEIKRILEKNKTKYKVVISPLYEQKKFSNYDLSVLGKVFGDNLYDFSGKNNFTETITNYYEVSHYRPIVGDSLLQIIYESDKL